MPPTATDGATNAAAPAAGDPSVTIVNAVQACREKDADRLRSLVAGGVTDQELETLFARGLDVQLRSQSVPEVADGQATVEVGLEVQRADETELVARAWTLRRSADGVWRFEALPDCY